MGDGVAGAAAVIVTGRWKDRVLACHQLLLLRFQCSPVRPGGETEPRLSLT